MAQNITETARLLVVSRESAVLRPLWAVAEPNSWQIETAVSAWDAIERVQSGATPHLLLLDLPRGDNDFLHILRWMRRLRPDLPVIVTCSAEDCWPKKGSDSIGSSGSSGQAVRRSPSRICDSASSGRFGRNGSGNRQ